MPFARPAAVLTAIALLATGPVLAQDAAPSLTEITEAWLASPHADLTSPAFTHWNEDGEIPGQCAVCHSATGIQSYLTSPMETVAAIPHPVPIGSVIGCASCHSEAASNLRQVPFPSGATIELAPGSAVCSVCHQGRASTMSVVNATGTLEADSVSSELSFINSHYALAGASNQGSAARGGYEYDGRSYVGPFAHVPDLNTCTACHSPHTLEVEISSCSTCHQGVTEFSAIRTSRVDFDGDGDIAEGIAAPIATLHAQLGEAIALYAAEVAGAPIVYASDAFPYYFNDSDADGAISDGEAAFPNRYASWTPRLLRAAYNYQFVRQDGGIHMHNPHYALQLLYDSLEDLGQAVDVDTAALTRP